MINAHCRARLSKRVAVIMGRNRDMWRYFVDGQQIRHVIKYKNGSKKTWEGIYDSKLECIYVGDTSFDSLSRMAKEHYKLERPDRNPNANGWEECDCEINGKWVSCKGIEQICIVV